MAIETSEVELWRIMKRILHPYSMNFNHKYDFTGHLFESRYVSSLIEDERYFLEVSRYIHLNPVKAKMVRNGAQLIFTSHDLSTMNNEVFRRDEIWFVAKGNNQNSKLYSLVEFKTKNGEVVRKDAKYDKQYLEGKYSADPYLRKIIDWSVVNAQALQRIKEEME